ncbi:hypothetical protein NQ317_006139 [Molorchus minor]|uniref:Uncharacterized protein n=1 Tax=Molorchus minor TaxID=1323400 RepID=A0ABQ9K2T9_9CUCU|nr:hypothetical protein NQ317_006139 [Molorchus minor]
MGLLALNLSRPYLNTILKLNCSVILASTSFDGPATTDAALAALAAEAGLIDPEPVKVVAKIDNDPSANQKPTIMEVSVDTSAADTSADGATVTAVEAATGLLGGSKVPSKLTLKGGSKIRMGLFGGSPILPPANFRYRMGLFGGSKDELENTMKPTTTTAEADSTQSTINGSLKLTETEDSEKNGFGC